MDDAGFGDTDVETVPDAIEAAFHQQLADAVSARLWVHSQTTKLAQEVAKRADVHHDRSGSEDQTVFGSLGDEHDCIVAEDHFL